MRIPIPIASLSIVVVLSSCGGNAARDQALKEAAAARARGDLVGEVEAMRVACAADPRNGDLCGKTTALAEYARGQTRAAGSAACGLVDPASPATIDGCLVALGPLRRLFPDDPDALRMADAAGDAFVTMCGAATSAIADAIRRVRCVEAGAETVATTRYAGWVNQTRGDAARLLVAAAGTAEVSERLGARAMTLAAAACIGGGQGLYELSTAAGREFAATAKPTLFVRSTGVPGAELCTATSSALGYTPDCVASPDSRTVVLEASVSVASIRHLVEERSETARYLAGVDHYDNPEYPIRARDELFSREQARDAEYQYRSEQQACDSADTALSAAGYCYNCAERTTRDDACRRADDAKAMWSEREDDWQRARTALDQTPAVLEHEDWRDTSYVIRDHSWNAPWEADLRALPGQAARASGIAVAGDSESNGSGLAGIAADPLTSPSAGWYLPSVMREVGARLANLADSEISSRVANVRAKCPSSTPDWTDAAWLDCYATAIQMRGNTTLAYGAISAETDAYDREHGAGLPALKCR